MKIKVFFLFFLLLSSLITPSAFSAEILSLEEEKTLRHFQADDQHFIVQQKILRQRRFTKKEYGDYYRREIRPERKTVKLG